MPVTERRRGQGLAAPRPAERVSALVRVAPVVRCSSSAGMALVTKDTIWEFALDAPIQACGYGADGAAALVLPRRACGGRSGTP